jgi:hypothetical protein
MLRQSDTHGISRAQTPAGQRDLETGVISNCCCCGHGQQRPPEGAGQPAEDLAGRFYNREQANAAARAFYEQAHARFIAPAQALVTGARRALMLSAAAVFASAAAAGAFALVPGLDGRAGMLPLAPALLLDGMAVLSWLALGVRRYDTMREARHRKRWIYEHELIAKSEHAMQQFHTFDPDDATSALWGLNQMALIARVHEHLDHNLHVENIMTGVRWDNSRRTTAQASAMAAIAALAVLATGLRAHGGPQAADIATGATVAVSVLLFAASLLLGNGLVARVRAFLEPPEDAMASRTDPFPDIAQWHHHLLSLLSRCQAFFRRWN